MISLLKFIALQKVVSSGAKLAQMRKRSREEDEVKQCYVLLH